MNNPPITPSARLEESDTRKLERAFEKLEGHLSGRSLQFVRWVRSPAARWFRMPLGLLLVAQSAVFFLPVAGLQFLPLGLMLLALDIPFLQGPVARMIFWLEAKWVQFRARRHKGPSR